MVLRQVNPPGIFALPFKRDAPRPIDVDAVALQFALQAMEGKSRQLHVLWDYGRIQPIQTPQASINQIRANSGRLALEKQLLKPTVLK